MSVSPRQVWFQNRRAKFRKQERLNQQKGGAQSQATSGQNSNNQSANGQSNQNQGQTDIGRGVDSSGIQGSKNQQLNGNVTNDQNSTNSNQMSSTVELKPLRPPLRGHEFLGVPTFWSRFQAHLWITGVLWKWSCSLYNGLYNVLNHVYKVIERNWNLIEIKHESDVRLILRENKWLTD